MAGVKESREGKLLLLTLVRLTVAGAAADGPVDAVTTCTGAIEVTGDDDLSILRHFARRF